MNKISKNKSWESFFNPVPSKALITSYGEFCTYIIKNNIQSTRKSRQEAISLYYKNFN